MKLSKTLLLFIVLLILSSCDLSLEPIEAISHFSGELVETDVSIPLQAYSGQRFTPSVTIINNGDQDLYGSVCLCGLDFLGDSSDCENYQIFYFEDEETNAEIIDFGPYTVSSVISSTEHIEMINSYELVDTAFADVCIKRSEAEGECTTVSGSRYLNLLSQNSLGPVQVKKVTESILDSKFQPTFIFSIELLLDSKKNELLYDKDEIYSQSCDISNTLNQLVYVEAELMGETVDCGFIEFENNEAQATCTFSNIDYVGSQGTELITEEEHELKIFLSYAYQIRESFNVEVVA